MSDLRRVDALWQILFSHLFWQVSKPVEEQQAALTDLVFSYLVSPLVKSYAPQYSSMTANSMLALNATHNTELS